MNSPRQEDAAEPRLTEGQPVPPSRTDGSWAIPLALQTGLFAAAAGALLRSQVFIIAGLGVGGIVGLLLTLARLAAPRSDARQTLAYTAGLLAAAASLPAGFSAIAFVLVMPLALLNDSANAASEAATALAMLGGAATLTGTAALCAGIVAWGASRLASAPLARQAPDQPAARVVPRPRQRPRPLALACGALLALQVAALPWGWATMQALLGPGNTPTTPLLARRAATITALPNGRILVAGGTRTGPTGAAYIATSALYDPSTGSWHAAAAMPHPRGNHTATLLADGRVLVAGGEDESGALAAAYLYDPAADRWSLAGSPLSARRRHTATLLADGGVLVVGGTTANGGTAYVAAAERYDPATNSWAVVASPTAARTDHGAVLLADGQVLVLGGAHKALGKFPPPERYDPKTDRWSPAGTPTIARTSSALARLPDGRVLVAGGHVALPDGQRGRTGMGTQTGAATELYDPATNTWHSTTALGAARNGHTLTILTDGRALAIGGADDVGNLLAGAEVYDPATGRWRSAGKLATSRRDHAALPLPNGDILVFGGSTLVEPDRAAVAERYRATTGRWERVPGTGDTVARLVALTPTLVAAGQPFPAPAALRMGGTATLLPDGGVLLTGGYDPSGPVADTERYDPAVGKWAAVTPLPEPRSGHTATPLADGRILVVGGVTTGQGFAGAALYDPTFDRWSAAQSPPTSTTEHTATRLVDGRVLVAGGRGVGGKEANAALYDPGSDRWTPTGPLRAARYGHWAMLLDDGRVVVIGSKSNGRNPATVEVYDPGRGGWVTGQSHAEPLDGETSTLLPDSRILVVGGNIGEYGSKVRTEAEVYDPLTATWHLAGRPTTPRTRHVALALTDGRVLVAGGYSDQSALEYFDPRTGNWADGGRLASGYSPSALLPLPDGRVLVLGTRLDGAAATVAEVVDPRLITTQQPAMVPLSSPSRATTAIPTVTRTSTAQPGR